MGSYYYYYDVGFFFFFFSPFKTPVKGRERGGAGMGKKNRWEKLERDFKQKKKGEEGSKAEDQRQEELRELRGSKSSRVQKAAGVTV